MDVRCFCTPLLRPRFPDDGSVFSGGPRTLSPPDTGRHPCGCSCPTSRACHPRPSHRSQCCLPCPSSRGPVFSAHSPKPVGQRSPAPGRRGRSAPWLGRCQHFDRLRPVARLEGRSPSPRGGDESLDEDADAREPQADGGACDVYSFDTRCLDLRCQHGCCVPSPPMHYAIYSSPVSSSCSPSEGTYGFSNNVAPVLLAVYSVDKGAPPITERLAQIDRTPTPSIPDAYQAFSRY